MAEALPCLLADTLALFGAHRQMLLAATVTAKQAPASGLKLGSAAFASQLPASQLPLATAAQQMRIGLGRHQPLCSGLDLAHMHTLLCSIGRLHNSSCGSPLIAAVCQVSVNGRQGIVHNQSQRMWKATAE
jgi:hypothetical protein